MSLMVSTISHDARVESSGATVLDELNRVCVAPLYNDPREMRVLYARQVCSVARRVEVSDPTHCN